MFHLESQASSGQGLVVGVKIGVVTHDRVVRLFTWLQSHLIGWLTPAGKNAVVRLDSYAGCCCNNIKAPFCTWLCVGSGYACEVFDLISLAK